MATLTSSKMPLLATVAVTTLDGTDAPSVQAVAA